MKIVRVELPDDQADALASAAAESGFASPSDLARVVIEDFLVAPLDYDRAALERDIARHQEEKRRGEQGLTANDARRALRDTPL